MSVSIPVKRLLLAASVAGALSVPALAQDGDSGTPAATTAIEEIIVTARRRQESAQDIPVAVNAFDPNAIYRQNIGEIKDLTQNVPGINFTASGGANNTVYSIRGRSRGVFGNALPAVTAYVNEVPLNTWGGSVPTYDMASLEVLKGPQGTLFGRNSTAGAVLATTARPEYEFSGYVLGKIGDYDTRFIEGAVNIPIVQDKVALRLAGQIDKRDGYTKNMIGVGSDDYDDHNRDSFRASLLIEPTENFSNLTVYEQNNYDEMGLGIIPVGYTPGTGALPFVPWYSGGPFDPTGVDGIPSGFIVTAPDFSSIAPCGGDPSCDIGALMERQREGGVRRAWHDQLNTLETDLDSWSNTTTWELGSITLRNIIGYRKVWTQTITDIDGTEFPMINTDNIFSNKQWTEEFQISGQALDGALEYIAGAFWLKSEPEGENHLLLQLFSQGGIPFSNPFFGPDHPFNGAFGPSDFYTDESKAVFGQVSYDLSRLSDSLAGLSVDIGVRYTKDTSENCPVPGRSILEPIPTESDCDERISADFNKTTYNLGLNYQLSAEVLIYGVTRTGYRAGGVNSPILGGALEPFQSYEPETVQDFELGLKSDWTLGDIYGRLNLALYRSEYEDIHYAVPTTGVNLGGGGVDGDGDPSNDPTGGLFYSNAGKATVDGIEVELIAQLTDAIKFTFVGSKMDKDFDRDITAPEGFPTEIIADAEVEAFIFLGAPDWSYTANVDYTLPVDASAGEMILSAKYFHISDIHYGGPLFASDYELVDFRFDWYSLMGTSLDAALYVTNAFDEEALVGPSNSNAGIGVGSGFYNPPRMWGASVRYNF
ncbi:MAG: hypothetical protein CMK32_01950 [Porticoccaceae bacterium]|nr:hypothetical protein [Porticoccaceae bacterium]